MSILGNAQTFGSVGSKNLILLQRYEDVSDLPATPQDQTLAIISSVNVTGFLWSATQPSPTIEGFVWIYENTNSSTIFHLNNQQLDFYPAGAMQVQTVDNVLTWVSVPLHAFVNNAWKQVRYDIIRDGHIINNYSFQSFNQMAVEQGNDYLYVHGTNNNYNSLGIGNLINYRYTSSPYNKLVLKAYTVGDITGFAFNPTNDGGVYYNSSSSFAGFISHRLPNSINLQTSLSSTYINYEIDISSTDSGYIYFIAFEGTNSRIYIKDLYMI